MFFREIDFTEKKLYSDEFFREIDTHIYFSGKKSGEINSLTSFFFNFNFTKFYQIDAKSIKQDAIMYNNSIFLYFIKERALFLDDLVH